MPELQCYAVCCLCGIVSPTGQYSLTRKLSVVPVKADTVSYESALLYLEQQNPERQSSEVGIALLQYGNNTQKYLLKSSLKYQDRNRVKFPVCLSELSHAMLLGEEGVALQVDQECIW